MRLQDLSADSSLAGLALMPLAWFALKEYQRERILVYIDPFRDPLGSAYNVIQAKIAIGSGQLLGKGSAARHRAAWPSSRSVTRISFSPCSPRCGGSSGCLVLLVAYALLVLRGFEIAARRAEPLGRLVALGVTALFATQALINLGMVTGLLPVVGIPLPFMSYGGSSMVVSLMALGLLSRFECGSSNRPGSVAAGDARRDPGRRVLPWESASSSTPV